MDHDTADLTNLKRGDSTEPDSEWPHLPRARKVTLHCSHERNPVHESAHKCRYLDWLSSTFLDQSGKWRVLVQCS